MESGFEPLSIHDNTTGIGSVPVSQAIAAHLATKLIAAGHSVDVGIMQINDRNFAALGLEPNTAFDPCRSIAAAATILAGSYVVGGGSHEAQQATLRVALSKYNTGDAQRGFDNGYVHKVEIAARLIVPALDAGLTPAEAGHSLPPSVAPSVPDEPNAPPSWDVWAGFDYAVGRESRPTPPAPANTKSIREAAPAADKRIPAAMVFSGSHKER